MKVPCFLIAWLAGILVGVIPFMFSEGFPASAVYQVFCGPTDFWSFFFARVLPLALTAFLFQFGFYAVLLVVFVEGFLLSFSYAAFCIAFGGGGIIWICLLASSVFLPVLLCLLIWRYLADDGLVPVGRHILAVGSIYCLTIVWNYNLFCH